MYFIPGRDQSMKIDDRKSIDQPISVDNCLLIDIDWHRPIDDQSIVTNEISLIASIAIDCHRLPSIAIDCHRLPSIAIDCHRLPSIAIDCHRLPSIAIDCHRLPSITIDFYRLSSIAIDCHRHFAAYMGIDDNR